MAPSCARFKRYNQHWGNRVLPPPSGGINVGGASTLGDINVRGGQRCSLNTRRRIARLGDINAGGYQRWGRSTLGEVDVGRGRRWEHPVIPSRTGDSLNRLDFVKPHRIEWWPGIPSNARQSGPGRPRGLSFLVVQEPLEMRSRSRRRSGATKFPRFTLSKTSQIPTITGIATAGRRALRQGREAMCGCAVFQRVAVCARRRISRAGSRCFDSSQVVVANGDKNAPGRQ